MATRLTLTRAGEYVFEDGTQRRVMPSAHAREIEPQEEPLWPVSVPVTKPPEPLRPVLPPEQVIGPPRLPPRTSFESPGYPKMPPRVTFVASALHEGGLQLFGPTPRKTRKWLPFSILWKDLASGHPTLPDSVELLRNEQRRSEDSTKMLNVFFTVQELMQGLDLDEVRTRTEGLPLDLRGFNIFVAPKVSTPKE